MSNFLLKQIFILAKKYLKINMAEEENRRGEGGDGAPGAQFMNSFIVMEDVLDKLKLLDYEASFCKEWGFKPFSRLFFMTVYL